MGVKCESGFRRASCEDFAHTPRVVTHTLIRSPKGSRDGVSTSVEPHVGKALVNLAARYGTSRTTE